MLDPRNANSLVAERHAGAGASWGSLFVGAVIALGIIFLLGLLGMALGFSIVDPRQEADPLAGIPRGTALYFLLAHLIALGVGGYAAARLAGSAWLSRALLHGVTVWALVTFFLLFMAVSGVGSLLSGTLAAVTTITGGAARAAQQVIPDNLELPDFQDVEQLIPDDFLATLPPELQNSLQQQNVGIQELRQVGTEVLDQAVSPRELQQAQQALIATITRILRNPGQAGSQIENLGKQLFGPDGVISQQDLQQATGVLQNRLSISRGEAETILNRWQAQLQQSAQAMEGTLQELQSQAGQVAQDVTDAIAAAAWYAFAASLLGLLAALLGSWLGRPRLLAVDRL